MSKNTAWMVILVLAIADVVAALWRFGGPWDNSNTATATEEEIYHPTEGKVSKADPVKNEPDEFATIEEHAFFRTQQPVDTATNAGYTEYSAQYANIQWPVAINGSRNLSDLHSALINALYGSHGDDIHEALNKHLYQATFNHGQLPFEQINALPDEAPRHHTLRSRHIINLHLNSTRLVEFEVRVYSNSGGDEPSAVSDKRTFVLYDKQRAQVLTADGVFADTKEVLQRINRQIDRQNRNGANLKQATRVPEFCIEPDRVLFIFPAHEIGYSNNTAAAVALTYKQLRGTFSRHFIDILNHNGNYTMPGE